MRCLLHVGIFLNCTWCELLVKFLFLLIPHVIEECNGLSSRCKVGSRAPEDEPCPGGGWWLEWFIYGYIPGKGAFQEQKHRQTSENFGRSPPAPPQEHVFYEWLENSALTSLGLHACYSLPETSHTLQGCNFARHLKAKSPLVFTLFLVLTLPLLGWV